MAAPEDVREYMISGKTVNKRAIKLFNEAGSKDDFDYAYKTEFSDYIFSVGKKEAVEFLEADRVIRIRMVDGRCVYLDEKRIEKNKLYVVADVSVDDASRFKRTVLAVTKNAASKTQPYLQDFFLYAADSLYAPWILSALRKCVHDHEGPERTLPGLVMELAMSMSDPKLGFYYSDAWDTLIDDDDPQVIDSSDLMEAAASLKEPGKDPTTAAERYVQRRWERHFKDGAFKLERDAFLDRVARRGYYGQWLDENGFFQNIKSSFADLC